MLFNKKINLFSTTNSNLRAIALKAEPSDVNMGEYMTGINQDIKQRLIVLTYKAYVKDILLVLSTTRIQACM